MFLPPSMAEVGVQELEAHHPSHRLTDPRISTALFHFFSLFHNSTTARYGCVKGAFLGSHEKKDGLLFFLFCSKLCRKKRGFFLKCI